MKTKTEEKTKLTKEFLQKEYRSTLKIILFSVFIVAGIFCFFSPLLLCIFNPTVSYKGLGNLLANMAFMLFIAVPFCWIGIKNIVEANKDSKNIKKGNYSIVEDTVTRKQMLQHGKSSYMSDSYCQLNLEKHAEKTGKAVVVKRSVYDESKKGDVFYLVYVEDELIGFYPAKKYEI